ncbi:phage tail protein [Escherichia coli]|uniref:phage tail protein n=1 Tax=Escherichia coli TaxID=562 RepID=UPI00202378F3|nr:phage tail protein [Escherichia coli]
MQNLMPPINTPDQLFHDGDPTQGIEGTLVTAGYLNNQQGATRDLQQELLNVLGGAHIQPDPKKTDQLLTALRALLLSRKNPFGDIKSDGTVPTALENLGLGEGSALPVGVPVPWPSATPPTGWLKCNGAAFSAEEYPELAKAYPTNKLPDLRGEFIRGWDDGRGVDAGRALLSLQDDSFEAHRHESFFYAGISRNETPLKNLPSSDEMLTLSSTTNALSPDGIDATNSLIGNDDYNCLIEGNKNNKRTATGLSTSIVGAAETRPRNISFNYIVRAA